MRIVRFVGPKSRWCACASIAVVAACSASGSDEPAAVDVGPGESVAGDVDLVEVASNPSCDFRSILVESSHVLDVEAGQVRSVGTDISSAETEGSYVPRESLPAERSLTTIASVRLVRQGDTRQSLFPAFENGDQVTLSQPQPVSALDATAGRSATFAAGQAFIGQEGEWVAHAAWHTEDGGMPEFFGPCASEFSTALETVAAGFGRSPDADFMVDLIARATEPGFLADVDLQFREDYSRFALDPGSVPPMMFDRLAQVFVHVSLSGAGESTFAVRSLSGYGALTVVNGDGTLTALIDRSGPIDVVSTNFNQTENSVLATVPAEVVGELEVLHVDANLESAEATYEMISLTELSARTGTPAEQLRVELDQINANISRSTEIANPFFTT